MSAAVIPAIDTERLILRGHRVEDFPECATMWAHPEVVRHVGGRLFSKAEVWTKLLVHRGHWSLLGFGYWVIREKASGRFVGEVGFADFKRNLDPSLDGVPEIGWALDPWAHGRGFATEAVRAVVQWGQTRFGGGRTFCLIAPTNAASIRVAEKCGYRECGRANYKGDSVILFDR